MQAPATRNTHPTSRLLPAAAAGPARLGAAVDVIVGHLRRRVLLQAWKQWQPKLTQGEVAARILERQHLRLLERSSAGSPPTERRRPQDWVSLAAPDQNDGDSGSDGVDDRTGPTEGSSPRLFSSHLHEKGCMSTSVGSWRRGRTLLRSQGGGSGEVVRCLSSPAATGRGNQTDRNQRDHDEPLSLRIASTGDVDKKTDEPRGNGERNTNESRLRRRGALDRRRNTHAPTPTVQACFKEERAAFIRDLQVLHRQLEAKDRDRERREREHQMARRRAQAVERAAQERVGASQRDADEAAAARALAEARAEAAAEKLVLQTTAAESLRARLRHCERQHKEQLEVERRQQKAAAEEASTERRRQEGAALTARKALLDGRRDWAAEKDTFMAAVREAGHRAELAEGEATEAKAHAVLLEERLQQTLEREAALNEEVEAQTSSTRDSERRVARAVAEAARTRAAAAAQEEAFLENVKDLEERASRAEAMYGGENASREDLQGQLVQAREAALAASSSAQRELSAMNLRVVSLGQDVSALTAENKSLAQRAAGAETLASSANSSLAEMSARLEEALAENLRAAEASAQERQLLEKQWHQREKRWCLMALAAQSEKKGGIESGDNGGHWEEEAAVTAILEEVEDLRKTAARLARDKAELVSQLSLLAPAAGGEQVGDVGCTNEGAPLGTLGSSGVRGQKEEGVWQSNVGDGRNGGHEVQRKQGAAERCVRVGSSSDGGSDGRGGEGGDAGGGSTQGGRCHEEAEISKDDGMVADAWLAEEGAKRRRERDGVEGDERGERGGSVDVHGDGIKGRSTLPEAEDEALLVPRGGPVPVPWMSTPTSLGAAGRGGAGGKSVAVASLRSTSSGRLERDLRRREHDALLALLRDENVISDSGHRVLARIRRKERRPRARFCRESGVSEKVKQAGCVGKDSGRGRYPEGGGGENSVEEEDEGACGRKEEGEDEEGGENEDDHTDASRLKTPLSPEEWRDVLAALKHSLRIRGISGAGEEEQLQRRPRRRRQMATADPTIKASTSSDGGRPGHRQTPLLSAASRPGSLSPEPPRLRGHSSCSSSCSSDHNGSGVLDPAEGNGDICGSPSCDSRPHRTTCSANPRKACVGRRCERSEVEEASVSPASRGPGGNGHNNDRSNDHRSDHDNKNDDDDQDNSHNRDCGEDASPSVALHGALTSALRDLLSFTLGVSEEGLREAPLPELVGALRREWEALLEGMAAMKKEVNLARQQADGVVAAAAPAAAGSDGFNNPREGFFAAGGQQPLPSQPLASGAPPGTTPATISAVSASAAELLRAESAENELHCAKLEEALNEAKRSLAEVRAKAEAAAGEAGDKLATSERDRAEVTARLVATLQELADERAEHAARLAALQSELQTSASSASTSRAAAAATAAEALAEAAVLRGTIEDWAGKAEGLAVAVESWKRRAEVAEKRAAELEFTAEEEAGWEGGHEEGREEGRREAEQRVEALESALEKLAETGWAAEGLSKEQLEVTREISMERDDLVEENEKCAARLDQLTVALKDQREEKSRLANQLLDRERGLEALRAQADVERVKVTRLQQEAGKAQGVCREMTNRLLELQATKEELRSTRERLADASRELKALRRSKDHSSGALDKARRLQERLDHAESVSAETSARAATAEAMAEEESRRARHLEARVDALQRQLDEIPNDLMVAHAEKRVLQGALDQAGRQAADVEAATAAELRRRDADIRNFAAAASLQQERCGERLREQALTIHQLTLQGFSADAQSKLQGAAAAATSPGVPDRQTSRTRARITVDTGDGGLDRGYPSAVTSARGGRMQKTSMVVGGVVLPPPRRGYDDDDDADIRRARRSTRSSARRGRSHTDGHDLRVVAARASPRDGDDRRCYGNDTSSSTVDAGGGWDGYSFDSEFPAQASKAVKGEDDRGVRGAPGSWRSLGSDEGRAGGMSRTGLGFREAAGGLSVSGGGVGKNGSPPLPRGHPPRVFRREL